MTNSATWKQNLGLYLLCSPKALNTTTKSNKYLSIHKINIEHPTQSFKDNPSNHSLCYSLHSILSESAFIYEARIRKGKSIAVLTMTLTA